ncbi:hypothetical protein AVEN_207125-1 [Araneus ventricosus]|uniref:Uncharacterized protein n=1 Tax=Araneus ventricosus TaxID=182803 RepID=A0A4Y2JEX9_ARAVE|nr:hypothetical protein AVEN_207125-1 [Araneus ventricosus]
MPSVRRSKRQLKSGAKNSPSWITAFASSDPDDESLLPVFTLTTLSSLTPQGLGLPDRNILQLAESSLRNSPLRGTLSKKRQRRKDYVRTFRKNPSRCANLILDPVDPVTDSSPFDDDFRSFWETALSIPVDHSPRFPSLATGNGHQPDLDTSDLLDPIPLDEVEKCFPRGRFVPEGYMNVSVVPELFLYPRKVEPTCLANLGLFP